MFLIWQQTVIQRHEKEDMTWFNIWTDLLGFNEGVFLAGKWSPVGLKDPGDMVTVDSISLFNSYHNYMIRKCFNSLFLYECVKCCQYII